VRVPMVLYLSSRACVKSFVRTPTLGTLACTMSLYVTACTAVCQAHFQARQNIAQLSAQLNDVAHQYRMVEKRLLVRYKDRNPTPMGGLDSLMKETYAKLLALSECVCCRVVLIRVWYSKREPFHWHIMRYSYA
jgi:hypothetical protein